MPCIEIGGSFMKSKLFKGKLLTAIAIALLSMHLIGCASSSDTKDNKDNAYRERATEIVTQKRSESN